MFNKVMYGFWLCMSCQCVTCCWVSITKMSLFACSDAIDVSLHDDLVAEAGRISTSGSIDIPDFCGLC